MCSHFDPLYLHLFKFYVKPPSLLFLNDLTPLRPVNVSISSYLSLSLLYLPSRHTRSHSVLVTLRKNVVSGPGILS